MMPSVSFGSGRLDSSTEIENFPAPGSLCRQQVSIFSRNNAQKKANQALPSCSRNPYQHCLLKPGTIVTDMRCAPGMAAFPSAAPACGGGHQSVILSRFTSYSTSAPSAGLRVNAADVQ
jgi:hypothetical protein